MNEQPLSLRILAQLKSAWFITLATVLVAAMAGAIGYYIYAWADGAPGIRLADLENAVVAALAPALFIGLPAALITAVEGNTVDTFKLMLASGGALLMSIFLMSVLSGA